MIAEVEFALGQPVEKARRRRGGGVTRDAQDQAVPLAGKGDARSGAARGFDDRRPTGEARAKGARQLRRGVTHRRAST